MLGMLVHDMGMIWKRFGHDLEMVWKYLYIIREYFRYYVGIFWASCGNEFDMVS